MTKPLIDPGLPKGQERHDFYLEKLISPLDEVGETRAEIALVVSDPVWLPQGSLQRNKMCDLICVYYDRRATCIELKGSYGQREKAKTQLAYGAAAVQQFFGIDEVVRKFVWYQEGTYGWEVTQSKKLPDISSSLWTPYAP